MVKQTIDVARATRLDDNLFFARSLIEHIGRETANRRQDVVNALGPSRIARIIEFAASFIAKTQTPPYIASSKRQA
jgi:hypothetical protein